MHYCPTTYHQRYSNLCHPYFLASCVKGYKISMTVICYLTFAHRCLNLHFKNLILIGLPVILGSVMFPKML